jgi:hypothetical protein
MKGAMKIHAKVFPASMLLAALLLSGCRILVNTAVIGTAVVVGTVGLVGYTVYKGGEAVVTTVGSVGSSATGAVKGHQESVTVSRGTFTTACKYAITDLNPAAELVLKRAGFKGVIGAQDALAGSVLAKTAFGENVSVKFALLEKGRTSVAIRIDGGNLKQSEYIYDQILATVAANTRRGGV